MCQLRREDQCEADIKLTLLSLKVEFVWKKFNLQFTPIFGKFSKKHTNPQKIQFLKANFILFAQVMLNINMNRA